MSFIIKTRGAGEYIVAEYRCPEHGVFEVTVQRDKNGDAPDEQPCPEIASLVAHNTHPSDFYPVPCGHSSPWTISATNTKFWSKPATALVRGGDMKERPPGMLDTRPLAEGMSYGEWRKKQDDARRSRRHDQLTDMGLIKKKIQVG